LHAAGDCGIVAEIRGDMRRFVLGGRSSVLSEVSALASSPMPMMLASPIQSAFGAASQVIEMDDPFSLHNGH
jgi:hypothetical protein